LPQRALPPVRTTVVFDNEASTESTALDVRGPDRPGLLHLVTKELSDIGLSIQLAMITTASGHVVDSFYVQDGSGGKITDAALQAEIAARIEKVVRGEGADDSHGEVS
jgi:[protein-PII] uridylyltransferase